MKNLNLNEFLKIKSQFQLGELTTESFHQKSKKLSKISNVKDAINVCKEIDVDALEVLKSKKIETIKLKEAISSTLSKGNRVFICGCGATGRLALSLEFLFREKFNTDQVVSFMAGGDFALIKSVEQFEDRLDFGKRQLVDLDFSEGDLLISITEGGETSFVIGASLAAVEISKVKSFFLYCNPDEELINIERSKKVIENSQIEKINLTVGAMTISGSTRMQATTVQMFVVGLALLNFDDSQACFEDRFNKDLKYLIDLDYSKLNALINGETKHYKAGGIITYKVSKDLAICALTDTTERSPTFSLKPFEQNSSDPHSLCYLVVAGATKTEDAWNKILKRNPRCLDWNDIQNELTSKDLYLFDISEQSIARRDSLNLNNVIFDISKTDKKISFSLMDIDFSFKRSSSLLIDHLAVKVLLNTHSTLVMTKLGRVYSNVMSYVRPSNLKLIDRATRYVRELSEHDLSYEEALKRVISNVNRTQDDESIVIKSLKA